MNNSGTSPNYFAVTDSSFWPTFNLRMPDELRLELQAEAKANKRSLNSEIILRLEQSRRGYRR